MTESKFIAADSSKDVGDPAKETGSGEDETIASSYPYMQILDQLQLTAIRAQSSQHSDAADAAASAEEKIESSPYNNNNQQAPWDLSADALLATLLHEFSSHVASRTHHVASEIRSLQNSVNNVGVDVALVQTEYMKRSADIFMEQVVGEDESESDSDEEDEGIDKGGDQQSNRQNEEQDKDDDDSSADIARLEAEEKSAIADGMKALSLFFDPKRSGGGDGGSGDGDTMIDMEEDVIGENCYYYPSADEDGFNQRPLPFIVGSREFMESSSAGLGGENRGGDE